MKLEPKDRYKYIVRNAGLFLQSANRQGENTNYRYSVHKCDAKRFDSVIDAREIARAVGGTVDRIDVITLETVDIMELIKANGEGKRWTASKR